MGNIKNKRINSAAGLAVAALLILLFPLQAAPFPSQSDEIGRVKTAIEVFNDIVKIPEEGLPEVLLKKAGAIAIIPGVIKAAYGIGGQYGKGIILVKNRGSWSNPCFIRLAGGSIGWQIGVQKTDVVLVFKSRKSVKNIEEGKITLGADISVTAGPVGRRAEASTDLELEAEIYSYSKSKGLFAGVSIKGASISIDHDANEEFYDRRRIDPEDILSSGSLDAPSVARELRRILTRYIDK
ncbi:lipid-binding SYLF domain-containing protein [Acidobacteriota bacterium]